MSNAELSNFIAKQYLKPDAKYMALLLAAHRNESTLQCNPTQSRLSELSGFKQQKVSRVITSLKRLGVIVTVLVPNKFNIRKSYNQYYFLYDFQKARLMLASEDFSGDRESLECVAIKVFCRANP